MALNKTKLNPKNLLQISLILLGIILIFFTYFYNNKQFKVTKTIEEKDWFECMKIEKTKANRWFWIQFFDDAKSEFQIIQK